MKISLKLFDWKRENSPGRLWRRKLLANTLAVVPNELRTLQTECCSRRSVHVCGSRSVPSMLNGERLEGPCKCCSFRNAHDHVNCSNFKCSLFERMGTQNATRSNWQEECKLCKNKQYAWDLPKFPLKSFQRLPDAVRGLTKIILFDEVSIQVRINTIDSICILCMAMRIDPELSGACSELRICKLDSPDYGS